MNLPNLTAQYRPIKLLGAGAMGEVFLVEPLGRDDLLDIRIGAIQLYALAEPEKRIRPGDKVHLRFNTSGVQFFDAKTERSLLWN